MSNLLSELQSRGMIHQQTPGLEKKLENPVVAYVGFDPTASSLHVGNLVAIMLLKHLQLAGHTPVVLVGGATGMIGDPSGKKNERQFLTEDLLTHNQNSITKQLSRFLDFTNDRAMIVNNYDWISTMSIIDFMRVVGKNVNVNTMLTRDSVKNRITDPESSISFTEFSYQLIQAYDFAHLYKNHNCTLQMGGSDQWGNMTAGMDLIHRLYGNEAEVNVLTSPLLTKSDGNKFGKSETGTVWLDADLTTPFEFFQFWLNQKDEDAVRLLKYFTFLSIEEINNLAEQQTLNSSIRHLQHRLAKEVTLLVHGQDCLDEALAATEFLFNDAGIDTISELSTAQFKRVFSTVPSTQINQIDFSTSDLFDILSNKSDNKIFSSKGDVRRTLQNGGLYINKRKITTAEDKKDLLMIGNKYWIIQKGKKNFHILEVV